MTDGFAPRTLSRFGGRPWLSGAGLVRRVAFSLAVLLAGSLPVGAPARAQSVPAQDESAVTGLWLSEKHDGVFQIARCGDALCGTLVGLLYGPTEPMPRAKDGREECRLVMLTEFRPLEDDPGRWGGKILDPDTGNLYHSQIWSPGPDVLKLRGYILVPVFGETQTWSRYTGKIGPACRLPANP